jgi:WD40 repeat protein
MAKHWHDLLPFYVAGQLPAAERIALEQHLMQCDECRAALDEWRALANAVRKEAQSRTANLPPLSPQLYRAQQDARTPMPSTSSRRNALLRKWNIEEHVTIRRPSARMEEDEDMNATSDVSFVPARPLQFPEARKLMFDPITWVAAILVMIVLGALLLFMRAPFNPGAGGQFEEAIPEFAAQPQPCVSTGQDPQAESVRLAGEAAALLDAEGDNTELAMLLSICALQTAYTPEADEALQEVLVLTGAVPEFPGVGRNYDGVQLSPDGRYLAIGSPRGAHLWNVETRTEVRTFVPPGGYVPTTSVAFSPDGRYILSTVGTGVARLWETETGAEVRDFDAGIAINALAISPDGAYIALGTEAGDVQVWDAVTGTLVNTLAMHTHPVSYVAFSPDSRTLVASANGPGPYPLPQWDVEAGVKIRDFLGIQEAQSGIFSPDGRYVIAGGRPTDARAILWDAATGAEIRVFTDFPPGSSGFNHVQAFAFSPDNRSVLIGSANRTARIFELETGAEVRSFNDNPSYVLAVDFSPDGRWLLIASVSSVVRIWDTDYRDTIARACEHVTRDFTTEERMQYGLGVGPACP